MNTFSFLSVFLVVFLFFFSSSIVESLEVPKIPTPKIPTPSKDDTPAATNTEEEINDGPIDLQKLFPNGVLLPPIFMDAHNPIDGNIPGVNTMENRAQRLQKEEKDKIELELKTNEIEVEIDENSKIEEETTKENNNNNNDKKKSEEKKDKQQQQQQKKDTKQDKKTNNNNKGSKDTTTESSSDPSFLMGIVGLFVGALGFIIYKLTLTPTTKAPKRSEKKESKESSSESAETAADQTKETKGSKKKSGSRKAD